MEMDVTIQNLEAYLLERYGEDANDHGLFMKLVEEIGEVAEVLNKRTGRKKATGEDSKVLLAEELADMIHYTVAIAAVNGIDLTQTILDKDRRASIKYNHDRNLETFLKENHG